MRPQVEILLAAYNGERFLAEQLDSILGQTCQSWRLLVRDDGSSDGTRAICTEYATQHPDRIAVVADLKGNLGVVRNFGELVKDSTAPYVMFSDQDDIWLPEKVERQLGEIRRLEGLHGIDCPLAVFTDALVINEAGQPICDSLLRFINRQRREKIRLQRLCVEANTYGCTMILNRALVNRISAFAPETISHDWWSGMVAAALGKLVFLDCALLKHRRHRSNVSPSKKNSVFRYLRERPSLERHRIWLRQVFAQCDAFRSAYAEELRPERLRMLEDLARLPEMNWLARRGTIVKHGCYMTGFARNVGFFLAL